MCSSVTLAMASLPAAGSSGGRSRCSVIGVATMPLPPPPVMSVIFASVFVCLATVWCLRSHKKQLYGNTALMLGSCGTLRWSSSRGGIRARKAPRYWSSAASSLGRAENRWLRRSQMVQQQALRDFDQAMRISSPVHTGARPCERRARRGIPHRGGPAGHVRRLNRRCECGSQRPAGCGSAGPGPSRGEVLQGDLRSGRTLAYRVRRPPGAVAAPGTGEVVGVDRGVVVSAALSTGEMLVRSAAPRRRQRLLALLQRKLARASADRTAAAIKHAIARLKAREADRARTGAKRYPPTWPAGST